MTTRTEALAWLNTALSDPALLPGLRADCPALAALIDAAAPNVRKPIPLPHLAAFKAAQATLWDNWPSGHRAAGYPNRYAVTLKVWTNDDVRLTGKGNHSHEMTASLMDAKALASWVKNKRKIKEPIHPIAADYLDHMEVVASSMTAHDLVGVFCSKQEGTIFHDHQWIWIVNRGEDWRATISVGGDALSMPTFDTAYANGAPLGGKGIGQSRIDLCGFSETWATAPIDNVVEFKAA